MCGIFGFIYTDSPAGLSRNPNDLLIDMGQYLASRGPDQATFYVDNNIYIGHARLTILDKEGGHQPMNLNQDVVLVFNGEIYNADCLRKRLELENIVFASSHSDTEVIYQGYLAHGTSFFSLLDGIFAFAVLDKRKNTLLLVRDHLGIKPLYFYSTPSFFAFSSQVNAFACLGLTLATSVNDLAKYFIFRSFPSPNTPFSFTKKLKSSHILTLDTRSLHQSISPITIEHRSLHLQRGSVLPRLHKVIDQTVRAQLVSDVPVAIFLSGGVDSSILAAIASKYGVRDAFTVSTCSTLDESIYARKVAKVFGLKLHILKIDHSLLLSQLANYSKINLDPVADPSAIALSMLSQKAASMGFKVLLSGDGADELFGGYNAYTRYRLISIL